jgi:TolA-binding protein
MKKCFVALAVGMMLIAVSLTGCGDEPKTQDADLQAQLQQSQNQIQQLQLQKQLADQQVAQAQQMAQLAQSQAEQAAQAAPAAQPVVVQAPAASHDNTLMDTMVGAAAGVAIGNMIAGSGNGGMYHRPTVIHRTTIVKNNTYRKPSAGYSKYQSKSSFKRSFGSTRTSFRRR